MTQSVMFRCLQKSVKVTFSLGGTKYITCVLKKEYKFKIKFKNSVIMGGGSYIINISDLGDKYLKPGGYI